jgi:transcription elongation factor Elf1
MPFNCTICGEESTSICVWCTKDTCANHLCAKCGRCSDCCECEVPLDGAVHAVAPVPDAAPVQEPAPAESAPDEPEVQV